MLVPRGFTTPRRLKHRSDALCRAGIVAMSRPITSMSTFGMDELDSEGVASQCNAMVPVTRENTAEILLRYASFATAGLPTQDVDHAIAILARQRNFTLPISDE